MGNLRLTLVTEGMTAGYQSKTLSLLSESDGRSSTVQLILCPSWPHKSVPVSNCVHLVDSVTKLSHEGPTIVLDQFGATEAAMFCVVSCYSLVLNNSSGTFQLSKANVVKTRRSSSTPSNR